MERSSFMASMSGSTALATARNKQELSSGMTRCTSTPPRSGSNISGGSFMMSELFLRLSDKGAEGGTSARLVVGLVEDFDGGGGAVPRLPKENPELIVDASVLSVEVEGLADDFVSRTASAEDEALLEVVAFAGDV
jgi:hypothetical protein